MMKVALFLLLLHAVITTGIVHAEVDKREIYTGNRFTLGIGAAIVRFDTKIKIKDKSSGNRIFLDPEGNLDLPDTSRVTTIYGMYAFSRRHSAGFSFFSVNRESSVFSFDKTFEDIKIRGNATMSDTTNFYRLDYGYTLFNDNRSQVKLLAGIYSLDLKYVFRAEGDIAVDGVSASGEILEEASVFAPLPLLGFDFWFSFTPEWSMATRVNFVTGRYHDLSAVVVQAGMNAQYRFNRHIGGIIGLTSFSADVVIEDNTERQDISYAYDGLYVGIHSVF